MKSFSGGTFTGVLEQVLHHHLTDALQGLLPHTINTYKLKQVLDVNCRTGAWAIDLVLACPGVHVTGIDSDIRFIETARHNAEVGKVRFVRFYEAIPAKPFNFADQTFDLVHQAMFTPTLQPNEWPAFLQQCMRVMKSGASINLTSLSLGPNSSEAYQRLISLREQLLFAQGYSFSEWPGPCSPGVHLCRLVNEAGFTNTTYTIHPLDLGGWNNSAGRACSQLFLNDIKRHKFLFLEYNLIHSEEFDALITQQQKDLGEADFCGTGALISVHAVKK